MRLTVTTFLTLDGVMQAPGGRDEDRSNGFDLGGWLPPHFDETVGGWMGEILDRADALLLGRRTYDIMAAYWPHVTDPAEGSPDNPLNRLPKHVATHRTDELAWSGSQRLDGDLATAVTELKNRPGGELQVHGSGSLVRSLLREGLIDTYHLLLFPVVLGRGQRLFADGVPPAGLRLTDSRTSGSGVTMLTYDSAGAPAFGTVGE
ncbi:MULTISPECIES: dihydrofolate reductase family protein [Micromonospora]|uniref:Dihydrofolate reductase n=1 Tax=Micromonospora solifontis TaxID=2487138 RepID=A0ABX9WDR0_9ACTN|nr:MULTISPECIES: dihydrofolate reductase family protein [Micromonospora]NES16827.1 dihydrofolate reductase [Micromonospora sp. PPF5-17B]NES37845.1 dihydrofolate reductase [Micromonospora solifontis]NES58535.1 dihydrofolate reductase [Micromonospora sp. PPF5-6]RNL97940.1 dihydrofolate reductase [Micromonospora solifontis]